MNGREVELDFDVNSADVQIYISHDGSSYNMTASTPFRKCNVSVGNKINDNNNEVDILSNSEDAQTELDSFLEQFVR